MFRRRRPLLRAAVVGGGAYMAGKTRARQSMERQQLEEAQNARTGDLEQLDRLAALHQEGVLTDDEFAAAKGKLLGT